MAKGGKARKGLKPGMYRVEDGRIVRSHVHCPKCGPGIYLARHADRVSCGRCGYTEFAKK